MNPIVFLLETGAPEASATGAGSGMSMWIMFGLIFIVMWLFMIRPQRKQQKEAEAFRNSLEKGDKVITAGGIHGIIAEVSEQTVLIKVDGDVKLKVEKTSLSKDPSEVKPQESAKKK